MLIGDIPWWAPQEILAVQNASISYTSPRGDVIQIRRPDGVSILVKVGDVPDSRIAVRPIPVASLQYASREAPSGFALGSSVLVTDHPGTLHVGTVFRYEEASCRAFSPKIKGHGIRLDDLSAERALLELLVRKSLSAYASRRLSPGAAVSVLGHSQPSWRAARSNAVVVDLSNAAAASGISVSFNASRDHATFSRGGHTYLLLLGADKMKKDGVWLDLPDLPMLKDGRWLVPVEAFSL